MVAPVVSRAILDKTAAFASHKLVTFCVLQCQARKLELGGENLVGDHGLVVVSVLHGSVTVVKK